MKFKNYKQYLTDYFIKINEITDKTPFSIQEVNARDLIVPERIDLIAKWIYIDFRERGLKSDFGNRIYKKHIEAFSLGTFKEPGSPEKNSIDKFTNDFNFLIDEIKKNGFNSSESLVPVGDDNIILDGAHRVAICAYFNKPITIIKFTGLKQNFDYKYFSKRGLEQRYLDSLVVQYCSLKPQTYAACIWPKVYSIDKFKRADKIIKESRVAVIAKKEVKVNYRGMKNLLLQIYGHHQWVGNHDNGFKGTERKVNDIYENNNSLVVYVLEADNIQQISDVKSAVREAYKIDNSSIHITDNQEETVQLVNLIFNKNSLHHINHAKIEKYKSTHKLISEFKKQISEHGDILDNYIVDSSSILSVYGLRDANDLDYLSNSPLREKIEHPKIDSHDLYENYYGTDKDDLIFNPENHFLFSDIKFVSLEKIAEMKKNRNERKDRNDIRLIQSLIGRENPLNYAVLAASVQIKIQRRYIASKIYIIKSLDSVGLRKPLKNIRDRLRNR